ncbi:MAG: cation transporter [Paludibacter sp.]|nr:cation transporter [Paludibacter sp.]
MKASTTILYNRALFLSFFSVFYNIIEGFISVLLGIKDETLTLLGFGFDSFIEVVSAIGITVMIIRMRKNKETNRSEFEVQALKVTGVSFYLLSIGLSAGIITNLLTNHKPETALWGIIISVVSIIVMIWLMLAKKKVGVKLNSEPIIADSNCTKICIYMSVVLLVASLIYEYTGFAYADAIGTAGLVYFSFSEGKEAFEKAKGKQNCKC